MCRERERERVVEEEKGIKVLVPTVVVVVKEEENVHGVALVVLCQCSSCPI